MRWQHIKKKIQAWLLLSSVIMTKDTNNTTEDNTSLFSGQLFANLPYLRADRDDALFTALRSSSFHLPLLYRRWGTKIQHWWNNSPKDVSSLRTIRQNVTFSHLYKAIWHYPGTSVPNHPETQQQHCHACWPSLEGKQAQLKHIGTQTAHPDQKGRVENVLDCPRERAGVDDELVIRYWGCCCCTNKHTWAHKKKTQWWNVRVCEVDFELTIILVITLQVSQDPFNFFLCRFLLGVFHFLQLTDKINEMQWVAGKSNPLNPTPVNIIFNYKMKK